MLIRYSVTNGGMIAREVKGLFGYRPVGYLDTEVRKYEKEMNDLIDKLTLAYNKYEKANGKIVFAKKCMKDSPMAPRNTSVPVEEGLGFSKWIKSFTAPTLPPKQEEKWKPFVQLLKATGRVKTVTVSNKPSIVVAGHKSVPLRMGNQNNNGGKKNKGNQDQNNQQDQQHRTPAIQSGTLPTEVHPK